MTATDPVLEIRDLSVAFRSPAGTVQALRRVDLTARRGEIVGLVGESGSGKSTLALAATRLLPANAEIRSGTVAVCGQDVLSLPPAGLRKLRGQTVAMVFQDPMTSLNPVLSIGSQMIDIQYRDSTLSRTGKRARVLAALERVGIPDAAQRLASHPHEFSGGMRQRIAIAMALLMNPALLIADEPTTALDVTLQAQIVHLLRRLRREIDGAILFVSHDLGLVAELCDRVVILYAGEVVEEGTVLDVFHTPRHPYTRMLLDCDPARIDVVSRTLPTIPGDLPDLVQPPSGCVFHPRCPRAEDRCRVEAPSWNAVSATRRARCHFAGEGA